MGARGRNDSELDPEPDRSGQSCGVAVPDHRGIVRAFRLGGWNCRSLFALRAPTACTLDQTADGRSCHLTLPSRLSLPGAGAAVFSWRPVYVDESLLRCGLRDHLRSRFSRQFHGAFNDIETGFIPGAAVA